MRNFIRGLIMGIMMLLMSLAAYGVTVPGGAYRPENVLQKSYGLWETDENGNWMFCAVFLTEDGLDIEAAKCWAVPYSVTSTRQARI
jgi:hypothetical protein